MIGFIESSRKMQQSDLSFGYRSTNSTDEMSCNASPKWQTRRREQANLNLVFDSRDEELLARKESCVPPTSSMSVSRRVRFQIPEHDIPRLADVGGCGNGNETHEDDTHLDDLFWTRKDLFICRKRAQLKANFIRGKFPSEVQMLEHVIQNGQVAATNKDGKRCHESDSKAFLVDNAASCLQFLNSETEDVLAMYNWSSSYVRGLEDYVTPILSSERHHMIHQFLSYQDFLRQRRVQVTSVEAALCEQSRRLSQNSRVFAFKMAIGDALAATHNQ